MKDKIDEIKQNPEHRTGKSNARYDQKIQEEAEQAARDVRNRLLAPPDANLIPAEAAIAGVLILDAILEFWWVPIIAM